MGKTLLTNDNTLETKQTSDNSSHTSEKFFLIQSKLRNFRHIVKSEDSTKKLMGGIKLFENDLPKFARFLEVKATGQLLISTRSECLLKQMPNLIIIHNNDKNLPFKYISNAPVDMS